MAADEALGLGERALGHGVQQDGGRAEGADRERDAVELSRQRDRDGADEEDRAERADEGEEQDLESCGQVGERA